MAKDAGALVHRDERFADDAPNYRYLIAAIDGGVLGRPERTLDYGCGRGQFVAHAAAAGLNVLGADVSDAPPVTGAEGRVHVMRGGVLPFADSSFDAVTANFVFEHIADPPPALAEIARVLKPGGRFLALFPTRDTWYEGHVGLFFPHWLTGSPKLLEAYLRAAHRLKLGYFRDGYTAEDWARMWRGSFGSYSFYHSYSDIRRWWRDAFGEAPRSAARDFMRFRLDRSRLRAIAPLARATPGLLEAVCAVRAGRVLLVTNRGTG